MLNPESLVIRRVAGVRPRYSAGGSLTGAGLADDPLLYTGGGATELLLDLLFDVSIAGSSVETEDVRELTGPLWRLAENAPGEDGYGRPPLVRFVWGKSWNMPGIVAAVAERLEYFSQGGDPMRSWLRMRLLRVAETSSLTRPAKSPRPSFDLPPDGAELPAEQVRLHEVLGGMTGQDGEGGGSGERLDEIAYRFYGNPALWRLLAAFNGLDDPLRIPSGYLLRVPSLSALEGTR
jgi:hypothetical protein